MMGINPKLAFRMVIEVFAENADGPDVLRNAIRSVELAPADKAKLVGILETALDELKK